MCWLDDQRAQWQLSAMFRPLKHSKLADWRGKYVLVVICRRCKHARRTEPDVLAKVLGWETSLSIATGRLRCSSCYSKDCEIQVDHATGSSQRRNSH